MSKLIISFGLMNIPFFSNLMSPKFSTAFALYFSVLMFLSGCGKDNDDVILSSLDGVWSHESHICTFSTQTPLENEAYTWSFNTKQKLLIVESSYEGNFFCVPSPGRYNIVLDSSKISIESVSFDYSVTSGELIVSDGGRLWMELNLIL